jgi:subtilase family serine protease
MLASFVRSFRAQTARPKGKNSIIARVRRGIWPALEYLEDRTLLTTAYPAALVAHPGAFTPAGAPGQPAGFSPAQIRQAYGFNQLSLNGAGQTIAIVDAYSDPNIASNLATFDATYGIAAPPSFTQVNESGGTSLPAASPSWGLEESLDVEWAHAIAPGAKIILVEASSSNLTDLLTGVNYARNVPGVSVVSMSWGASEFSGESSYDSYFTTPAGHTGVTFVASSGDSGSAGAPEWPSISSNVLAVGGTQLTTDVAGDYEGETAWSGSGGGISAYESQPSFQKSVVTQSTTKRTVPDVAYDGSGSSPFAVYDTYSYSGWLEVYGTSAGAPQWSALVALADQGRAAAGKAALDGPTQTLPDIYQLPSSDFHDVTSGSNGGYSATAGYDLVTGRGSPVANLVVAGLVGGSTTTTPPAPTPPKVVTAAHAGASTVTGISTTLGVSGTDAAGAASLTYTWSITGEPAGVVAPTFSVNGTNAAQNTVVTFHAAGTYTFLVTLKDPSGLTATSSVTVTVKQTQTYLALTPGSASLLDGQTKQFSATAEDQFGRALSQQPAWTWSITAGGGSVSKTGLYTAPSGNGASVVRVSGGGQTLSATVTYTAPIPTSPSGVTATPVSNGWVLVRWSDNSNNESGFLVERSTNGVTWSVVGAVGANVTFFDDTTAARAPGASYRVAAYDSFGTSVYSAAAKASVATVAKAATAVASPAATLLPAGSALNVIQQTLSALESTLQSTGSTAAADAFWQAFGEASGRDLIGW